MIPSYPSYTRRTNQSIQFAVPNKAVVKKILQHSEDDENPRLRAAGNTLYPRVRSLARLMSQHRIQLETIGTSELGITLFLPLSLYPPPKSTFAKLCPCFKKPKAYKPKLWTISETQEDTWIDGWGTTYEDLGMDSRRRAIYVAYEDNYRPVTLNA